jgi:predicted nucleic acid-binding Zn ribbon protein
MPMYVYQVIEADGSEGEIFEVLQGMNDKPLTHHPETGQPVRRLLGLPNVAGKMSESGMKASLSSSNLERLGFTQYKKSGKGTYEKTAGKGPDVISGK